LLTIAVTLAAAITATAQPITAVHDGDAHTRSITVVKISVIKLTSRSRKCGNDCAHRQSGNGVGGPASVTSISATSVSSVLLRSGELRMRTIRAAVLSVRNSIDYSRIVRRLVVAANLVAGATAVLLAGFVAVATGLN
jgi:hypothetical protein